MWFHLPSLFKVIFNFTTILLPWQAFIRICKNKCKFHISALESSKYCVSLWVPQCKCIWAFLKRKWEMNLLFLFQVINLMPWMPAIEHHLIKQLKKCAFGTHIWTTISCTLPLIIDKFFNQFLFLFAYNTVIPWRLNKQFLSSSVT